MNHSAPISPSACRRIGLGAILLGLAAATAGGWFFVLGLQATEPDDASRHALTLAGVVLILVELGAFGVASLMPRHGTRAARLGLVVMAAAVVLFEIATMSVTQLTLAARADQVADANQAQALRLRAMIDGRRATIAGLQANAAAQSQSKFPESRAAGAEALRQATAVDAELPALVAELARIEAARRPTLSTVLGEHVAAFAVARSALVVLAGVGAMGLAGLMFRAARAGSVPAPTVHVPAPSVIPTVPAPLVAYATPTTSRLAAAVASVPLAAGIVPAAATVPVPAPVAATVPKSERQERAPRAPVPRPAAPEGRADTGTTDGTDARYSRVADAVRNGDVQPTVRAIRSTFRTATDVAQRYLVQLERDGITKRAGRGYALAAA
jgi:hypothetical protein